MWIWTAAGVKIFSIGTSLISKRPHLRASRSSAVWIGLNGRTKARHSPNGRQNDSACRKNTAHKGLKIWKPFGLQVKDPSDKLVGVDDPRLIPIWEAAGELKLPVVIHVADPVAFFDPIDEKNERWEELREHPDWAFTSPPFPSFMEIMDAFQNLVRRHKNTTFIGAHVGCYGENLGWVGRMLDDCPNYYIDVSARLGELGRQPYSARKFLLKYQDRVLFGSDMGPDLEAYRLYYRFFETDDEYFNYNTSEVPGQGRWYVHGMYLPDEVLKKIYRANAMKVLKIEQAAEAREENMKTYHTYLEIKSQTKAWAQALDLASRSNLPKAADYGQVVFTGCGSTYYLSLASAALYQELTGRAARAVPGGELLLNPQAYLTDQKTLLVAISRSGTTTETVKAVENFKARSAGKWL